jgi:hemoglobin/transferrin/lactoferrin receptor protein
MKNIFIALSISLVYFTAAGQQKLKTSDTTDVLLLLQQNQESNPLIFSAAKPTRKYNDVPNQVLKIQSAEISLNQPSNTADLLQKNGNVFVQKSQMGGGSPIIRGLEANRISLVVDGVRMNNLIYRGGHLQNLITVDVNALEDMEVLYGPSSNLYGSDALGGVISMRTHQPKFSNEETIHVNSQTRVASAAQEFSQHFDVALQNKNWSTWTSFTFNQWGDLRSGKGKNWFYDQPVGVRNQYAIWTGSHDSLVNNSNTAIQKFSAYKQYDFIQKMSVRKGLQRHTLNIQYSNSTNVPRYDRLTDISGGQLKYGDWYYGPQTRGLVSYIFHHDNIGKNIDLDAQFNYQTIEESRYTRKLNNVWLDGRIENVQVASTTIALHHQSEKNEWQIGLDGQWNDLKSTSNSINKITSQTREISTRYSNGINRMNQISLFAYNVYRLNANMQLHASARAGFSSLYSTILSGYAVDGIHNEITQQHPTYSAAIGWIYKLDNYNLSSNINTGYRVPNIDDLSKIFETSVGNVVVPNSNLKSEQATTWDISIRHNNNNPTFQWSFNAYNTWLNNFITTAPTTINGQDSILYDGQISPVVSSQNQDKGYIRGAQLNMSNLINTHWRLDWSANVTKGRFIANGKETPMDHIPPVMAMGAVTYMREKWSMQLSSQFQSWKKLDQYRLGAEDNEDYATANGTPAWMIFNYRLQYQCSQHSQLIAGVDNILDVQYRTFASGINASGRNVYLSYRFNF